MILFYFEFIKKLIFLRKNNDIVNIKIIFLMLFY